MGKGSDSAIVEKARYEKALLGSSSRLKYKPFKQKKSILSLREIFRKIEKTYFFSINVRILYGKR